MENSHGLVSKNMNLKQLLVEQFTACYDKNTWFVALKNTLVGVTASDAAWKPEEIGRAHV